MSKQELIQGLNQDLSGEWGAVMRYTYQSGKAFGLAGAELRNLLQKEILDELGHASYLTDVIVDLGGEPTTKPLDFEKPDNLQAMLELDLKMELQDVENYTNRAQQAKELGMTGLKVKLEEIAADESDHARQLRRLLRGL